MAGAWLKKTWFGTSTYLGQMDGGRQSVIQGQVSKTTSTIDKLTSSYVVFISVYQLLYFSIALIASHCNCLVYRGLRLLWPRSDLCIDVIPQLIYALPHFFLLVSNCAHLHWTISKAILFCSPIWPGHSVVRGQGREAQLIHILRARYIPVSRGGGLNPQDADPYSSYFTLRRASLDVLDVSLYVVLFIILQYVRGVNTYNLILIQGESLPRIWCLLFCG